MESLRMKMENGEVLEEYLMELINHDVRAPMANFAYFMAISKDKALATDDSVNLMPLLQPFFASSSFLLENFINWRRICYHNEAELPSKFYLHTLVNDVLSSVNCLLIDKEIKAENNIATDIVCFGSHITYTFVIKNLILTCLYYDNNKSALKIEVLKTLNETSVSVAGADVFIPHPTLKILMDINYYKKISAKDIGILLSKELLQCCGGALDIACDENNGMIFTAHFGTEML